MRALTLVVAVIACLLTACGGGGGSGAAKSSPAADKTASAKISLRQSDFPSGWTSAPHQVTPEETATLRQLTQCVGIPDLTGHTTARDRSNDFSSGQATSASSNVVFATTDADASSDLAAFQSDKTPDCLKQAVLALTKQQLSGTVPANLDARQLQFPTLKDGTAAYQASFTVSVAGTSLPVYADFVYIRAGRAEVLLGTTNAGSPFDRKLEESLVRKMADRA